MSQSSVPPTESTSTFNLAELPILRAIVEGTAQAIGENFFQLLVRNLSLATGTAGAFIAEFAGGEDQVRSLAFWEDGEFVENQEW